MIHARARLALVGGIAACVLILPAVASASTKAAPPAVQTAGATTAGCLAHVPGNVDEDWYEVYTHNCTGHDEPELDPVSNAPHSAWNITWHVALPAGGSYPVSSVGPTFWFGGAVADSNPVKLGGQGFLELQIYPDSFTKACASTGGFRVVHTPGVYTACSPVWTIQQKGGGIIEPAAFNGMIMNPSDTGPLVMYGRDVLDIHIWANSMDDPYQEQITDETTGETSQILVLNSPTDGPLTPAFDTQEIGNALSWGGVWDTPMSFVYEIGHSDLYGDHPGQFCVPGQTFCGSFNSANWAGTQPLRIFDATFGDGSHPQHWAAVSDTGGKAEVLGKSFVGPTDCSGYGGPFCIYPWFSWDGQAFNFGTVFPNTTMAFGRAGQFAKQTKCGTPPNSPFEPYKTYCSQIIY
jgi:hypothetical protein